MQVGLIFGRKIKIFFLWILKIVYSEKYMKYLSEFIGTFLLVGVVVAVIGTLRKSETSVELSENLAKSLVDLVDPL